MYRLMSQRVALITGANTGIGLALARRLLQKDAEIHLCLACRSQGKAEQAKQQLLSEWPKACITILLVDVSSLHSVYKVAKEIRRRFRHLDLVYLNAGVMPSPTVNWKSFWQGVISGKIIHMIQTGEGLLVQEEGVTTEGLQQTFATNLFGHFVLVKEIEMLLGGTNNASQIIWTSSSNARQDAFSIKDLQHKKGHEPYAASKYATDLVSAAMNDRLNEKGVYSHVTCPGLVMTNMTHGIMPEWFWLIMIPFLWLLRLFAPNNTLYPHNGSEALFWLSKQDPVKLDARVKFHSQSSVFGYSYVHQEKLKLDSDLAANTYQELERLEQDMRKKVAH